MHTITVSKTINIPKEKAWETISDFQAIYKFHPDVESSPIQNNIKRGLGAERICTFYDGGSIGEKVTNFEEGESLTFDIVDTGPLPLKKATAFISVRSVSKHKSAIDWRMDFDPKFGPLGWLMAKLVLKSKLKQVLTSIIKGVEDHVTTGKIVGPKGELQSANAAVLFNSSN